jgi:hypothetical protein
MAKVQMSEEEAIQKIGSLKSMFQGQQFQWIKSPKPELLGKVVKCIDVNWVGGDVFMAQFEDGSKVPTQHLNSNLMMISEHSPAMSIAQIQSINHDPRKTEKADQTEIKQSIQKTAGKDAAEAYQEEKTADLSSMPASALTGETEVAPKAKMKIKQAAPKAADLFGSFSTEPRAVSFEMEINLPSMELLKMMAENAKDKKEFTEQLSQYIIAEINNDVIKGAIQGWLGLNEENNEDA